MLIAFKSCSHYLKEWKSTIFTFNVSVIYNKNIREVKSTFIWLKHFSTLISFTNNGSLANQKYIIRFIETKECSIAAGKTFCVLHPFVNFLGSFSKRYEIACFSVLQPYKIWTDRLTKLFCNRYMKCLVNVKTVLFMIVNRLLNS